MIKRRKVLSGQVSAVALGAIAAVTMAGAFAAEKISEKNPAVAFDQVSSDILKGSQGLLKLNSDKSLNLAGVQFRLVDGPATYYTLGEHARDPKFNQLLFQTDVRKYIASENTTDFLEAKRSYYSRLNFDLEHQRHERLYPYLFDWKSLNHAPIRELTEPLEVYAKEMKYTGPDTDSKYFDPNFQKELDEMSQTELSRGNKLTVLPNGKSQIEKIRQVKAAKHFIFAAVMAWECDEGALPLIDAMIEKRKEGLDVRIIMEKFYPDTVFKACYKRMEEGGIDVVRLTDKFKYKFAFMHNKFFTFDGTTGIIGGQNIAHFETLSDGFNHYNRDTDLLIEGPAAADILENFIDLWENHVNRRFVSTEKHSSAYPYRSLLKELRNQQVMDGKRGQMHYADWLSKPETRMDGLCRIAIQRPYGRNFFLADLYAKYFDAAKHHIVMTTPDMHFDADDAKKIKSPKTTGFYKNVREAAKRGVRIDQISNGRDGGWGEFTAQLREWSNEEEDKGHPGWANYWARKEEKQTVSKIGETRELLKMLSQTPNYYTWTHFQYIHAKQILWDNIISVIGSVNLDNTALDRNHEGAAICMDESLAAQMRNLLTLDLINSTPVVSKNNE